MHLKYPKYLWYAILTTNGGSLFMSSRMLKMLSKGLFSPLAETYAHDMSTAAHGVVSTGKFKCISIDFNIFKPRYSV